jgi:hypothetical protein
METYPLVPGNDGETEKLLDLKKLQQFRVLRADSDLFLGT